jgi:flagellin-like protein
MKQRRAISPILAVVILMTIAIMGGGMLYGLQNQILVTGLSTIDLRITDLRLEKDVNGACYFQTVLYNSGTEVIQKIHLKTTLDNGDDFVREINNFGGELGPRDSTEHFEFLESSNFICGNFTTSNTYSVFVNATSFDSKFSIIKSMKVGNITQT